jgi:hypothetical protein
MTPAVPPWTVPRWAILIAVLTLAAVPAQAGGPEDPVAVPALKGTVLEPWSTSRAVGLGLLTQGSQSPTAVFRLDHPPGTPMTLRRGQREIQEQTDWANYFCDGGSLYLLDYELLRLRLGIAYGVTDRTQIGISSSTSYQGGGSLDGLIEWFERSVGAINHSRLDAPRNRYLIRVRSRDGSILEYGGQDSGWHVENMAFELKHQLLEGSETTPALAASAIVKLPVGGRVPGRPDGGVDVGASLSAGLRLGRFNLYGSLGVVAFGSSDSNGVDLMRYQPSTMSAVEYRATPRTSVVGQALVSGPVARHFGDFSDRTVELAVGVKHRIGRNLLLEASVVENLLVSGNSADVAFHERCLVRICGVVGVALKSSHWVEMLRAGRSARCCLRRRHFRAP